ncbi:hypothetical protein [Ekhidna sp.]|uniref:hypothetical protein n=1 Tax=Ekhidna sp. TaxID=2608089 RepID=UPI003299D6E7
MKSIVCAASFLLSVVSFAQSSKISTIDFVQIQNDNIEEAIFYYENNWLVLRKMAVENGFIDSYEIIQVEAADDSPFHLILKTTYPDKLSFEKAEERFSALINEKGALRLLNNKQPADFRKVIFSKTDGKHLF